MGALSRRRHDAKIGRRGFTWQGWRSDPHVVRSLGRTAEHPFEYAAIARIAMQLQPLVLVPFALDDHADGVILLRRLAIVEKADSQADVFTAAIFTAVRGQFGRTVLAHQLGATEVA